MQSFIEIKNSLNPIQVKVLSYIWKYYLDTDEWIPVRVLHHKFDGKKEIWPEISKMGGSVIFEGGDFRLPRYQLTFLGVLLTENGGKLIKLIRDYLSYSQRKVDDDPLLMKITDDNIKEDLGLSSKEVDLVGKIIRIGSLYQTATQGKDYWEFSVPQNIEDLPEDLEDYIHKISIGNYKPNFPVSRDQRISYTEGKDKGASIQESFDFLIDKDLRLILNSDWVEAKMVFNIEAWKSCLVLCGAIIEGMLFGCLIQNEKDAIETYKRITGKERSQKISNWSFIDLVEVSKEIGLLRGSTSHLSHAIRLSRNLIHPARLISENVNISKNDAEVALNSVRLCRRDLGESTGSIKIN